MQKLLSASDAAAVARAMVAAGVVEVAPPGSRFVLRSGRESPCKIVLERLFDPANNKHLHLVSAHFTVAARHLLSVEHDVLPQFMIFAGVPTGGSAWAHMLKRFYGAELCEVQKVSRASDLEFVIGPMGLSRLCVCVEDVLTFGGSSKKVIQSLRYTLKNCRTLIALVSYEFEEAETCFAELGVACGYCVSFEDILTAMRESGKYSMQTVAQWLLWREDYHAWQEQFSC